MVLEENVRVSGVSLVSLRGGLAWQRLANWLSVVRRFVTHSAVQRLEPNNLVSCADYIPQIWILPGSRPPSPYGAHQTERVPAWEPTGP